MVDVEHIADRATFIAALPDDDAEARAAREHAKSCAECAAALERGAGIIQKLDALPPLPAPSAEALRRASESILAELDGSAPLARGWPLAAATLVSFGLVLALAKHRAPEVEAWQLAAIVGIAAAAAAFFAPRWARGSLAAVTIGSACFAFAVSATTGLFPAIGVKCTILELVGSALPLGAAFFMASRGTLERGRWRFAASAAAGAIAAQAALNVTCPVHTAGPHLWVFHVGGVVLAAVIGAALGAPKTRRVRA
jgi:hypothetical protein